MLIRKDVYKMAVPVLIEQLFITSMGVINTMIASGIGKEALSAIGTVDSFNNILLGFFSSLAVGGTVVVAQYMGQQNIKSTKEASKQAIFSTVILSVAITIVIFILKDKILLTFFGKADKEVLNFSLIYFGITLLTYPLAAFSFIVSGVLRATNNQDKPMKINIFMNIINIVLSYLLIYGININNSHLNISIPGMQVKGAAIALFIARLVGAILFLIAILNKSEMTGLRDLRKFKLNMAMQKSILNVGLPTGIESFIFNIGKFVQQIFIVSLGTVSIASNSIAWSMLGLLIIPGNAFSIVSMTMVGNFMGRKDYDEVRNIQVYLMKITTALKVVISVIVFPLATIIASIYSKDPAVVALTSQLIRMNAFIIPILWPVSFLIPAGLRGTGDSKFTMVVSITSLWIFRVFVGYLLCIPLHFGIIGLWSAMYLDWFTRGVIYTWRLKSGRWTANKVI